jgi:hypothetical protein
MPERGGSAERMERGHNVLGKRGKQGEGRAVALDPTWAVRTEETSHPGWRTVAHTGRHAHPKRNWVIHSPSVQQANIILILRTSPVGRLI